MKKRGVSPLIASVLLIAFVIMIFVLITTWVRRTAIEPSMQAGSEKLASALECINTEIEIVDVCRTTGNEITINVDNFGDTTLSSVGMRVVSTAGTKKISEMIELGTSTAPYGRIERTTSTIGEFTDANYGTPDKWKVEIYPNLKTGLAGICRDAMQTKSGVSACPP